MNIYQQRGKELGAKLQTIYNFVFDRKDENIKFSDYLKEHGSDEAAFLLGVPRRLQIKGIGDATPNAKNLMLFAAALNEYYVNQYLNDLTGKMNGEVKSSADGMDADSPTSDGSNLVDILRAAHSDINKMNAPMLKSVLDSDHKFSADAQTTTRGRDQSGVDSVSIRVNNYLNNNATDIVGMIYSKSWNDIYSYVAGKTNLLTATVKPIVDQWYSTIKSNPGILESLLKPFVMAKVSASLKNGIWNKLNADEWAAIGVKNKGGWKINNDSPFFEADKFNTYMQANLHGIDLGNRHEWSNNLQSYQPWRGATSEPAFRDFASGIDKYFTRPNPDFLKVNNETLAKGGGTGATGVLKGVITSDWGKHLAESIDKAIKDASAFVRKAIETINKYNPVTIAMRMAFYQLVYLDIFGLAHNLFLMREKNGSHWKDVVGVIKHFGGSANELEAAMLNKYKSEPAQLRKITKWVAEDKNSADGSYMNLTGAEEYVALASSITALISNIINKFKSQNPDAPVVPVPPPPSGTKLIPGTNIPSTGNTMLDAQLFQKYQEQQNGGDEFGAELEKIWADYKYYIIGGFSLLLIITIAIGVSKKKK